MFPGHVNHCLTLSTALGRIATEWTLSVHPGSTMITPVVCSRRISSTTTRDGYTSKPSPATTGCSGRAANGLLSKRQRFAAVPACPVPCAAYRWSMSGRTRVCARRPEQHIMKRWNAGDALSIEDDPASHSRSVAAILNRSRAAALQHAAERSNGQFSLGVMLLSGHMNVREPFLNPRGSARLVTSNSIRMELLCKSHGSTPMVIYVDTM